MYPNLSQSRVFCFRTLPKADSFQEPWPRSYMLFGCMSRILFVVVPVDAIAPFYWETLHSDAAPTIPAPLNAA
jgi:hypothetical protein